MGLTRYALLAALAVASLPVAAQTRATAAHQDTLVNYRVATETSRPIGGHCVYHASVRGTLNAAGGDAPTGRVRDVLLHTRAGINCRGREVNTHEDLVVLPATTVEDLNGRVTKGLSTVILGRPCVYTTGLTLGHGRVDADRALTWCKLTPLTSPMTPRSATRAELTAPADPADEARFGAH